MILTRSDFLSILATLYFLSNIAKSKQTQKQEDILSKCMFLWSILQFQETVHSAYMQRTITVETTHQMSKIYDLNLYKKNAMQH